MTSVCVRERAGDGGQYVQQYVDLAIAPLASARDVLIFLSAMIKIALCSTGK